MAPQWVVRNNGVCGWSTSSRGSALLLTSSSRTGGDPLCFFVWAGGCAFGCETAWIPPCAGMTGGGIVGDINCCCGLAWLEPLFSLRSSSPRTRDPLAFVWVGGCGLAAKPLGFRLRGQNDAVEWDDGDISCCCGLAGRPFSPRIVILAKAGIHLAFEWVGGLRLAAKRLDSRSRGENDRGWGGAGELFGVLLAPAPFFASAPC